MALDDLPFSNNVVRDPPRDEAAVGPRDVENVYAGITSRDQGQTIHVDANSGYVKRENADGSVTVMPPGAAKPKKRGAAKFNDNLAEDIDSMVLATIANRLLERIEADLQSRKDWEETAVKGVSLIGVKLEEASAEIGLDGLISRVKHTGLLGACLASWANSRAELLPVGGPVKVRDDSQEANDEILVEAAASQIGHNGGPPLDAEDMQQLAGIAGPAPAAPPGAPPQPPPAGKQQVRSALADAFEHDFNHYLTVIDKDYYPDTSRMLMSRALLGCQFKKVYFDPLLRRPVSRWVKGTDLIVSQEAASLSGAARVTERIPMRQSVAKRYQKLKQWRDIPLVAPQTEPTPIETAVANIEGIKLLNHLTEDHLHTIYESYTELGFDGEGDLSKDETGKDVGFPLPYRVTIDKMSRLILEIRRNWKKGDPNYEKRRRYVKYGHVPGLGFYDWGFVHLLGNPQRAATVIEQTLIDCGMLNSFPGGIMAKSPGSRQRTTEVRMAPGEWTVMDTGGLPVSDFAMPLPYKEPSATLQAVGVDIASQMKQIAGIVELPVGEGRVGNTPVGTIMAYIEAVTKVPSAIHKDDHVAQQEEFELLKELFEEDPAALVRGAKKPKRQWAAAQEIADQDLVPAADPNTPSQTHRLMKASLRVQLAGMPQFAGIPNQRGIWESTMRVLGDSNPREYTMPQQPAAPPPPDPKVVVANIKLQGEQQKAAAQAANDERDHQARMEELAVTSADKDADRESELKRAILKHSSEKGAQHSDLVKHMTSEGLEHQRHHDNAGIAGAELAQGHIHHLNELDAQQQQAEAAAAAAAEPEPPTDAGVQ